MPIGFEDSRHRGYGKRALVGRGSRRRNGRRDAILSPNVNPEGQTQEDVRNEGWSQCVLKTKETQNNIMSYINELTKKILIKTSDELMKMQEIKRFHGKTDVQKLLKSPLSQ
jgi:hypothetical protein